MNKGLRLASRPDITKEIFNIDEIIDLMNKGLRLNSIVSGNPLRVSDEIIDLMNKGLRPKHNVATYPTVPPLDEIIDLMNKGLRLDIKKLIIRTP